MYRVCLIALDWGYWGGEEVFTYSLERMMNFIGIETEKVFLVYSLAKRKPETFDGKLVSWKDIDKLKGFDEYWITTGNSYRERYGKDSVTKMSRLYERLFKLKPMKIYMHRRHYYENAKDTLYSNKEANILTPTQENRDLMKKQGYEAFIFPLPYYQQCPWNIEEAVEQKESNFVFATRISYDKRLSYFLSLSSRLALNLTVFGHTKGWERNFYFLKKKFGNFEYRGSFTPDDAEKVYGKYRFLLDGSKYGDMSGIQYSFLMALDWFCVPIISEGWHCECFDKKDFPRLTFSRSKDYQIFTNLDVSWKKGIEKRREVLFHHNPKIIGKFLYG